MARTVWKMLKSKGNLTHITIFWGLTLCPFQIMASECDDWVATHPEWVWCDSFESDTPLGSRYEDVSTKGLAQSTQDAMGGIASLRQTYTPGQVDAGWIIKVKPESYPDHIFFRWHHKYGEGYTTFPPKMARAGYRQRSGSSQAVFMVHSWVEDSFPTLVTVEPKPAPRPEETGYHG